MALQKVQVKTYFGQCRCCLSYAYLKNMWEELSIEGEREIYGKMLFDCFSISWTVRDKVDSDRICENCISRLRDALEFKNQVLKSQGELLQEGKGIATDHTSLEITNENIDLESETSYDDQKAYEDEDRKNYKNEAVDEEQKTYKNESSDEEQKAYENVEFLEEEVLEEFDKVDDSQDILIMSESMRERLAKDDKTKSTRKRKNHDSKSDISISQAKEKEDTGKKKKIVLDIPEYVTIGSKREIASDNTKIRANIILLLKNSTILPFRNNIKNTFKCFYCERSYQLFKDLREHTESEHRDNVTEMTIFKSLVTRQQKIINADISSVKCKLCDKEIKTIDNLIEHLTERHRKIYHNTVIKPSHGILSFNLSSDAFICHICKDEFKFFKNLSIHMNEHYEFFVCNSCGKKFVAEHRYRSHIFNTHGKKEVNCEHCGKTFKSKSVLLYHTNKEHVKVRINCSECSETFPMTQTVRRAHHMEDAHGIKIPLYKCEICGKDFANSGSLAGHKKNTHYQAKQYNCEICNFTTFYDKTMKSHMDIHYGIKIFECRFCQKSFTKRNTLRVHMKIHLNDKPFACPLCDVAFIQKRVLKSHMKAKHPDSGIAI